MMPVKRLPLCLFAIMMVLLAACLILLGLSKDRGNSGIILYQMETIPRVPHVVLTQEEKDRMMSFDNEDGISLERMALYYNDHKETYYSQNVLPGEMLEIPGRHVAFDGTIRDEDGYICVACDYDYYGYGEVVETSIGWGKVYDTGCAYGTVDIYTDW